MGMRRRVPPEGEAMMGRLAIVLMLISAAGLTTMAFLHDAAAGFFALGCAGFVLWFFMGRD